MLAREERSSKRLRELVDSRRAVFVEYQSALNQLAGAAQRTQFTADGGGMGAEPVDEEVRARNDDLRQAQVLAQNALAAVELLVDPELASRARAVYTASELRVRYSVAEYGTIRGGFLAALLEDLRAHDLPGSQDQRVQSEAEKRHRWLSLLSGRRALSRQSL